ncbi:zinc finger CCCH domain-containing protein 1-like [Helianthus annuus]|uniref:zinc finger CCCH domain-containing protein 1-like n=1 Tax=Helianthus annuus TaxID=4232 RepID=UPI001652C2B4|nr:zinc finger CCCH domain-containing protein 1-like [Helianthus annuus]
MYPIGEMPQDPVTSSDIKGNTHGDIKAPVIVAYVCNFFRKPSKNKNIRKKPHNEQEDDSTTEQEAEPLVIINKKKQITPDNKLHFATAPSKRSTVDQQHPVAADTKATIFQFDSSKEIHGYTDYKAGFRREIIRRPGIVGTVIRGDYKSGWQMEKEWDEAKKARKRKLAVKGDNDDGEN